MGYKKFLLKKIISMGENWLNKKKQTEHKYSVFFQNRNKKISTQSPPKQSPLVKDNNHWPDKQ